VEVLLLTALLFPGRCLATRIVLLPVLMLLPLLAVAPVPLLLLVYQYNRRCYHQLLLLPPQLQLSVTPCMVLVWRGDAAYHAVICLFGLDLPADGGD